MCRARTAIEGEMGVVSAGNKPEKSDIHSFCD